MSYRIIAQRILDGEFLSWDFPLSQVQVQDTLSGPTVISGVLEPELPFLNVDAVDAWAIWLHVEQDGEIRASGILQPIALDSEEESISVEAEGASGYPHGIPFLGQYEAIQVDPLDVVRRIWAHIQAHPDGKLGVVVDATTSPVRIGTEERDVSFETGAGEQVEFTAGPYKLHWWDHRDCGQEINQLAQETPFDYRDTSYWNADKTNVLHRIELGYPRLGRRQHNLRFAQDENLLESIPLVERDDAYASAVIVLGAGEGRDMVRGTAQTVSSTRLRRPVVIEDKTITSSSRARARANSELSQRTVSRVSMRQITVDARHPNAKLGSFTPGDDIAVTGDFPYIGRATLWHRITASTWEPDSEIVILDLAPSESFRYGPEGA